MFDLMALVWGAGEIRGLCKVALMGASGEQHAKVEHGADCDATERDVHRPASRTGRPQALSKPSSAGPGEERPWKERETIKEIYGLPAGTKREGVVSQPCAFCHLGHDCNRARKQTG